MSETEMKNDIAGSHPQCALLVGLRHAFESTGGACPPIPEQDF